MTLQEISDRLEIQDLLARYSAAIDGRCFDDLDALFTADAVLDYTEMGGIRADLAGQKAFLKANLPAFVGFQHLAATSTIDLEGDTARVRTICFNPMVLVDEKHVLFCGMWYRDVMVRTATGWRISDRHQDRGWSLDVRTGPRTVLPPAP